MKSTLDERNKKIRCCKVYHSQRTKIRNKVELNRIHCTVFKPASNSIIKKQKKMATKEIESSLPRYRHNQSAEPNYQSDSNEQTIHREICCFRVPSTSGAGFRPFFARTRNKAREILCFRGRQWCLRGSALFSRAAQ